MKTKNQTIILMDRIVALQQQQTQDFQVLKEQYHTTINSFSMVNLLKTSVQEVISTPHLTSDILHGALKMGTQYLSKSLLTVTPSKTMGWIGKIVQLIVKK